ncbi:3-hydroxyacyl-ACP dehydratase FabZ [Aureimonas ureilytica]|uniref:3-hydroxyacyl-ACP dehydratase FabZ n=1 Tax=Aureimonas ureilytica TaxID=401562 RepID=UPI00036F6352|nr:3-hydroxyacyl-ACP dehydratase FabZ [Aureimonas ureilytica]
MTTGEAATTLESVDILKIMQLLPHRYPFLLVDRIIEIDGDRKAIGIKNVTASEPHFQGHFPHYPVMPGVLIIEGMAQTAGAICQLATGGNANSIVYFMTIDNAKFRKPVVPGDTLQYHVTQTKKRGNIWKFDCVATVSDQKVAEATISAMLVPEDAG